MKGFLPDRAKVYAFGTGCCTWRSKVKGSIITKHYIQNTEYNNIHTRSTLYKISPLNERFIVMSNMEHVGCLVDGFRWCRIYRGESL
jgi:hypothetical protein